MFTLYYFDFEHYLCVCCRYFAASRWNSPEAASASTQRSTRDAVLQHGNVYLSYVCPKGYCGGVCVCGSIIMQLISETRQKWRWAHLSTAVSCCQLLPVDSLKEGLLTLMWWCVCKSFALLLKRHVQLATRNAVFTAW